MAKGLNFPSFSEGLSLRQAIQLTGGIESVPEFPFLFGGTFIEAITRRLRRGTLRISLPFRRDFH